LRIADFLSPQAVVADMQSRTKPEVLRELSATLAKAHKSLSEDRLVAVLQEREKLGSTGIGEGVAIPHGKLAGMDSLQAAFCVSRQGVDFESIDGKPTHLFFALVAPENSAGVHLKALARISRLFKNPRFRAAILEAPTAADIHALIVQEDARP
jgi:nitrogen PTS system EIIA component